MNKTEMGEIAKRMDGALEAFRKELAGLRTGRAHANLLDPVMVEAYGQQMHLNQVGTVSVPEPRLITVTVWDKSMVKAVDRAIRESGLGLNPQTEGTLIRIPMPEMTADRRKELTKVAHKYAEQARVAVRNVRRDGMERLKKEDKGGTISQDEHRRLSDEIQQMTDKHIATIDQTLATKEKEILQV
ncbi:MAG: ribosome recycling factor [Alphaproteobacteria bacterium]|nr:ribosome recycling factor [Alphaproteobacteria bacterium]